MRTKTPRSAAGDVTPTLAPAAAPERLQKLLAAAGVGSRREVDAWIAQGRVTVEGVVAELGTRAVAGADIRVDGAPVGWSRAGLAGGGRPPRVIIYHKPEGELCTRRDPQGRDTVFASLPRLREGRWVLVGRLDLNTSGLLLVTTDGDLAARLMHPSGGIEREYAVRVLGTVAPDDLDRLCAGVTLDDGSARFLRMAEAGGTGANRWYHVVIGEGRQREVRRLWEAVGARVSRLIRFRYGPIDLDRQLRPGKWRDLNPEEMAAVYRAAGLPVPARAQTATEARGTRQRATERRTGRETRKRPPYTRN